MKMVEKDKSGNVKVQLKISDVPVGMAREFSTFAKIAYNDMYWVLLKDLMRKAEAYDLILSLTEPGYNIPEEKEKNKENEEPLTMGRKGD